MKVWRLYFFELRTKAKNFLKFLTEKTSRKDAKKRKVKTLYLNVSAS